MDTRATWLCYGTSLLLVCGAPAPSSTPPLSYHPAAGRTLERSFRETSRFEVESLVRRIGETVLPDPTPDLKGGLSRELEVVDTIARTGAGRPTELRRRFVTVESAVELRAELEGGTEDYQADLESPLEGHGVVFTWDDDEEAWQTAFAGDEPEEGDLLGRLREDLDLRALLPADEVSEGDSWTIDAAELADLLAPGGELSLRFGYEPDGDFQFLSVEELTAASLAGLGDRRGEFEGELTAEWIATEGEAGARRARIELKLRASIASEEPGQLARRIELSGLESRRQGIELRSSWTLAGGGQLVWDLDAGVFVELELELEWTGQATVSWMEEFGRHELDYQLELGLTGETTLSATSD